MRRGKTDRAGFEALVEDDETVFVPVEELDAVRALVAEDEELTGKRLGLKLLANTEMAAVGSLQDSTATAAGSSAKK